MQGRTRRNAGPAPSKAPPPEAARLCVRLLRIKLFDAGQAGGGSRERKMAAPAGGGGSAVSVLAPNGRRHTVKVTPSTVLLQVRPRAGGGREEGGDAAAGTWRRPPLRLLRGPRGRGREGTLGRGLLRPMNGLKARRARLLPRRAPGARGWGLASLLEGMPGVAAPTTHI